MQFDRRLSALPLLSLVSLASLAGCPTPAGTDSGPDTQVADSGSTDAVVDDDVQVGLDVDQSDATDSATTDGMVKPGTCGVTPAVAAHTTEMSTMGWGALNRTTGVLMYGCTPGQMPNQCLSMHAVVDDTTIGAMASAIPGASLRFLYTGATASNYWSRVSVDGRFYGRGTHVHDMIRNVEIEAGPVADFDPAFFPDNSRFMYQPMGYTCPMSLLTTGTPTLITFMEPGCSRSSVGLYEHLGVALGGGDYWATAAGSAAFDNGGRAVTLRDPPVNAPWTMRATTVLTLMGNTGTAFTNIASVSVQTPFQGDGVISPSSRLLLTRYADEATGRIVEGYVLHRLNTVRTGAAITATLSEIARYCVTGTKPAFSFDERYVTFHHYVTADDATDLGFTGSDDPGFATYLTRGSANVYILDLVTGIRTRVTTMRPGQYALFPSFRSDGWLYFTVRQPGMSREHVIASDAALVLTR